MPPITRSGTASTKWVDTTPQTTRAASRRPLRNSVDFAWRNWSGRRDSNPRPQPWQGCALPLSYTRIRLRRGVAPGVARFMAQSRMVCNRLRAAFFRRTAMRHDFSGRSCGRSGKSAAAGVARHRKYELRVARFVPVRVEVDLRLPEAKRIRAKIAPRRACRIAGKNRGCVIDLARADVPIASMRKPRSPRKAPESLATRVRRQSRRPARDIESGTVLRGMPASLRLTKMGRYNNAEDNC